MFDQRAEKPIMALCSIANFKKRKPWRAIIEMKRKFDPNNGF
jgi:hypothetical protein